MNEIKNENEGKCFFLTTYDNPFDPSTEYDQWYDYDFDHGYHCDEYLAREVSVLVDDINSLSDAQLELVKNEAINRIILRHNISEVVFKKITIDKDPNELDIAN